MEKTKKTVAIVLAAGYGRRMQSDIQKQYMLLKGHPLIYYTLKAFEASDVDEIVLVTGNDEIDYCKQEIVRKFNLQKVEKIIAGGKERYDSVYKGLLAAEGADYVLIHDGARPFVTPDIINRNIASVKRDKACITAVLSKDTVKIGDEEGFVADTPARKHVWIVQTPQSFAYNLIREAYELREAANDETVTDDAMVVEKFKHKKVRFLEGDYRNIKITTPEDMLIAEAFLA